MLMLPGGDDGPKIFKRFTTIDDPCRQLSYISDEEGVYDAIMFVPKKAIKFAGFSVYRVESHLDQTFTLMYKYKIGSETSPEIEVDIAPGEVDEVERCGDVNIDPAISVAAGIPITIMVSFKVGEEFFCSTLLGYGGENYLSIPENEERDLFEIRDTPDCTKGETDTRFGNIPRLFYFNA